LLLYLPPDAQDRLLDDITALSAERSQFAADAIPNLPRSEQDHFRQRIEALVGSWRNHGFDADITDIYYLGERNDVATYLNAHGWETGSVTTSDLFAANGLGPVDANDDDRCLEA
jgi:O-methyltransferase involved in polyketide biosynthesis